MDGFGTDLPSGYRWSMAAIMLPCFSDFVIQSQLTFQRTVSKWSFKTGGRSIRMVVMTILTVHVYMEDAGDLWCFFFSLEIFRFCPTQSSK